MTGYSQSKKLKFLFISSDKFPPFRVDISVLFGKELVGRGHIIDWLLQSETACEKPYEARWSGCRVFVGPTDNGTSLLSRLRKHAYGIRHDLRLINLVRKNDYDFVQVKDKFISAILAILVSKIKRIKFIYWLSYPFPEASLYGAKEGTARYPLLYYLRGLSQKILLYKFILPMADHAFVQSEQMKRDIISQGVLSSKLTPIPMGISLAMFPYKKEDAGNTFGGQYEKSVVYIGTLAKVRRMDFLIRVFGKVRREVDDAKLYIVGGSENTRDVEELIVEAEKIGIRDAIVFTGRVPRDDALQFVKRAQVCVSPFFPTPILNSTSPTKLIEYMAMGKAVVANDHPEQYPVVNESGGGICVPYDEDAFAKAIVRLLKDHELANHMGILGRRYVEEHRSYVHIAGIVENTYFHILDCITP